MNSKTLYLLLIWLQLPLLLWGQSDTPVLTMHADTLRRDHYLTPEQVEAMTEELLLEQLHQQAEQLAQEQQRREAELQRQRDSAYTARLETDITTVIPYHIGFADSIKIANFMKRYGGANPLAMELVFKPLELDFDWNASLGAHLLYKDSLAAVEPLLRTSKAEVKDPFLEEKSLTALRSDARKALTGSRADLYKGFFSNLPDKNLFLNSDYKVKDPLSEFVEVERSLFKESTDRAAQLRQIRAQYSPWRKNASALLQFTQNYVSKNWYKGGNSNIAILGILNGNVVYDDKKSILWENVGEWRAGFNSVAGDTIRKLNTNEDQFRIYSKLGVKAFGKFYYSGSVEFQTQLFKTYSGINSTKLRTTTFSPIRVNANVGLDYKPNSNLSIVLSPFSYKYIYVNDTVNIKPKSFGIDAGKNMLSEIGSSLRVEYTYRPAREIHIVSKLYFYTNYEKVELDLEIVCNFIINRYMTTRIMINPRYDNTVIMENKERAQLQFKEMISVGFAHKF